MDARQAGGVAYSVEIGEGRSAWQGWQRWGRGEVSASGLGKGLGLIVGQVLGFGRGDRGQCLGLGLGQVLGRGFHGFESIGQRDQCQFVTRLYIEGLTVWTMCY